MSRTQNLCVQSLQSPVCSLNSVDITYMWWFPGDYWCVSRAVEDVETRYVSPFVITLLSPSVQWKTVSNFYWESSSYQHIPTGQELLENRPPPPPHLPPTSQHLVWFSDIKRTVHYLKSSKVKCNAENCKILNRLQKWGTGWKKRWN